jgi:hypothetical protein
MQWLKTFQVLWKTAVISFQHRKAAKSRASGPDVSSDELYVG